LDVALIKWLQGFKDILGKVKGFERNDTYYFMPRTSLYIRGFTTLKQYLQITKEKRTGNYKLIRDCVILLEYCNFKFVSIFRVTKNIIIAPVNDKYFALFVGNHRLRLSSISFDNDLVIDLTQPHPNFNKSSVNVVDSCFSALSPCQTIVDNGYRVLSEERLSGVAINRLPPKQIGQSEIDFLLTFRECSLTKYKRVNINEYVSNLQNSIFVKSVFLQLHEITTNAEVETFTSLISNLIDSLNSLEIEEVAIAPSHRDLNRGNVLACEGNNLRVIDWEFFGWSYCNYDVFVFLSNYRHSQDFRLSWSKYKDNAFLAGIEVKNHELIIFALEEIVFFVENYSVREWKNIRDFKVLVESLKHAVALFYKV